MKRLKNTFSIAAAGVLLATAAAACGSSATEEPEVLGNVITADPEGRQPVSDSSIANSEPQVLEELVRLETAALDQYYHDVDPQGYVAQFAAAPTYFDPWSAGRIDGETVAQHLLSFTGTYPVSDYAIVDPAVSLRGDVAIFTFQVETYDPASQALTSSWNATEIREKIGGSWQMVHAHWSPME